jgi:integrase
MSGHVQDRWWRDKKDENGKIVLNAKGKPVREKTELYGKGLRYKVRYYINGKEKSESFPDKQLRRAQDFLAKMQTDVLAGLYVDPKAGKADLRVYVAQWRKGQSADPVTQQTIDTKLNGMVWPFFEEGTTLDSIDTDKVRDWLEWMQCKGDAGIATKASYRATVFDLMSAIMSGAVDDKKIHSNPFRAKSIKRPKPEVRKIVPWRESKLRAVQLALPVHYQVTVPLGAGLALRQMEILAFSPDDVDRGAMEATIDRQIRWIGQRAVFAPPKGGKTRVVPMGEGVLDEIDDYLANHEPVAVTLPWIHPGGDPVTANLLIGKATDGLASQLGSLKADVWRGGNFLEEIWKPAFVAAGLIYVRRQDGMHAMRHMCASNWLAQGVSIKEVSEYLGHHDPGYTLRIYTHLVPSSHQRARLASDKIFRPRRAPATA